MNESTEQKLTDKSNCSTRAGDHLSRVLAANVRYLRKHHGLSQSELASRLGVAPSRVSQIERYEAAPTLAIVERLAEAFEIDPPVLVTEFDDAMQELEKAGR